MTNDTLNFTSIQLWKYSGKQVKAIFTLHTGVESWAEDTQK